MQMWIGVRFLSATTFSGSSTRSGVWFLQGRRVVIGEGRRPSGVAHLPFHAFCVVSKKSGFERLLELDVGLVDAFAFVCDLV